MDWKKEADNIIPVLRKADEIIFDQEALHQIITKGPCDYVTHVDLGVQHYLKKELLDRYPSTSFMGEEEGESVLHTDSPCWILDPIDGTTNLIHGYQHSAISLGLWEKGQIVLGLIYQPFTKEIFFAALGEGAYRNGEPVHVSSAKEPGSALLTFGTDPYEKNQGPRSFALLSSVYAQCQDIRRSGSAALDLAYVACGRTDGFFEIALKPWDYAAGSLMVTEAGGMVSNWKGEALPFHHGSPLIATNGFLHPWLLEKLKG